LRLISYVSYTYCRNRVVLLTILARVCISRKSEGAVEDMLCVTAVDLATKSGNKDYPRDSHFKWE